MEHYAELARDGLVLRGMLHLPDEDDGAKTPFVVLFHGFRGERNEKYFMHTELSRRLSRAGIGSVRFDFAGSGESDGRFEDMTFGGELADAAVILNYVRSMPFVDQSRVALHGMSMGGAVAAVTASREEGIRALSLWAPALTIDEKTRGGQVGGVDVTDIDQLGSVNAAGLRVGAGFCRDMRERDILSEAVRYGGPIQIVHGDSDQSVPLSVSQRYCELLGGRAELCVLPGVGHGFEDADLRETLYKQTVDFLCRELLGR
ncbi:alpha/beta hydrolase family protein [Feifania hominis]|uniref:Alpha/beta hydrolase n=1 Tax=Feifania hominis TaxID=2763660 RepID=A0A926HUX9_9FIRM|nr:alpha/beta hydrolase [Feifania hominis]MBC8536031.1 alpha/beta hydrolase [Feifania hominis]